MIFSCKSWPFRNQHYYTWKEMVIKTDLCFGWKWSSNPWAICQEIRSAEAREHGHKQMIIYWSHNISNKVKTIPLMMIRNNSSASNFSLHIDIILHSVNYTLELWNQCKRHGLTSPNNCNGCDFVWCEFWSLIRHSLVTKSDSKHKSIDLYGCHAERA